jgi:hypothetical protein
MAVPDTPHPTASCFALQDAIMPAKNTPPEETFERFFEKENNSQR